MMTPGKIKRIGLVGCGVIGSYIAKAARKQDFAQIDFVYDEKREAAEAISGATILGKVPEIINREVDLVIESAVDKAVREIAPLVLTKKNLLIFSVTSLADDSFRNSLQELCRKNGTRLYIPHGAILGLDGIYDGRSVIEEVTITTTKHPKNLGLKEPVSGTLYDGPTRGACAAYPRNVNVHAAVAVVGLGFDRTRSVVVADPNTTQMTHEIVVKGPGMDWYIRIASKPVGAVTGSYTPESAAMTVRRILANDYGIVLA
jgi:aspartate dehydrogenase